MATCDMVFRRQAQEVSHLGKRFHLDHHPWDFLHGGGPDVDDPSGFRRIAEGDCGRAMDGGLCVEGATGGYRGSYRADIDSRRIHAKAWDQVTAPPRVHLDHRWTLGGENHLGVGDPESHPECLMDLVQQLHERGIVQQRVVGVDWSAMGFVDTVEKWDF